MPKKVRVWLPYQRSIPYIVEVEKVDVEEVKEAMRTKDPSDWEYDPCFYESLASWFSTLIEGITETSIEIIDEGEGNKSG